MIKRFFSIILLLCFMRSTAWAGCLIMPVQGGGTSCDSCSGTLVASFHFEDTSGHDLTVGTPCGCTDSSTTTYSLTGGSSYSASHPSDGTYGVQAETEDDAVEWAPGDIDLTETGTWCADVYYTGTADGSMCYVNDNTTDIIGVVDYDAGGSVVRVSYGATNFTGTDTFSNSTQTRICISWDESQADGSDALATKVGSNSWEENTTLTLVDDTQSTVFVVGGNWQYARGFYDNVKIYSDYAHSE